jgi:hypothetical protein
LEDFFREARNRSLIEEFFSGTSAPKLCVYLQSPDVKSATDELVDSGEEPRLIMTFGDTDRIKKKGAYFLRLTPEGKGINPQLGNELDMIFGEIGSKPIMTLENALTTTYLPIVNEITDWGECDEE